MSNGGDTPQVPHWDGPFLLQLVALGAAIADAKLRDRFDSQDFADPLIRGAVRELKARGKHGFLDLQHTLKLAHLEWSTKQGHPLDALIKRLKLDAAFDRVWSDVRQARDNAAMPGAWGDENKAEFVRMIVEAGRGAAMEAAHMPKVRPVDANRDGAEKIGKVQQ